MVQFGEIFGRSALFEFCKKCVVKLFLQPYNKPYCHTYNYLHINKNKKMKQKILLSIVMLLTLSWVSAQTLVSTDPQLKNAVLEEFTGIHCGYCPDGHAIAAALLENNPNRVVVIAIHQGSFAVPSGGEPDYRTPYGDAIAAQTGLTGYPNGTVNRHIFMAGHTAMSRGDWTPSANTIMQETSPVNVGIMTEYNDVTRERFMLRYITPLMLPRQQTLLTLHLFKVIFSARKVAVVQEIITNTCTCSGI